MNEFEPCSIGRRQMLMAGAAGVTVTLVSLAPGAAARRVPNEVGAVDDAASNAASPATAVRSLVLSGCVVDARNQPLSGVAVEFRAVGRLNFQAGPRDRVAGNSDADGRFLLDAPWAAADAPTLIRALEYRLDGGHWRTHAALSVSQTPVGAAADPREAATVRAAVRLIVA